MARTNVTEAEWDAENDDDGLLRLLVRSAILAPSGHNTQPWLFRVEDGELELLADRTRALPVVDPDDRELTISCGAALGFLRVAATRFGRRSHVTLTPDEGDRLARFRLEEPSEDDPDATRLFEAMVERYTDRGPYRPEPVDDATVAALRQRAEAEEVWLDAVTDDAGKAALADAIAEGDRLQMADRRFRRELAAWMHPNRTTSRDGLPSYALGVSNDLLSEAAPTVVRLFDLGRGQAAKDRELAEGSPALLVLGTEDDTVEAWLRAGQALAMLWLEATARGHAISFLNQPIEEPELRPEVDRVLGHRGFPQLLMRLGRPAGGGEDRRTPRRPVSEVLRD